MSYPYRPALILPVALQQAGNDIACALGHDEWPGHSTHPRTAILPDRGEVFGDLIDVTDLRATLPQ